jgi:hypothetical protein
MNECGALGYTGLESGEGGRYKFSPFPPMSSPVNREPNETNRQSDEEDIPGLRIPIVHRDEQRAGNCKLAKHTETAGKNSRLRVL